MTESRSGYAAPILADSDSRTSEPVLEVEGLSVELKAQDEWRRVVSDVSLRLGAGEALGLVGESGSGKSVSARAVLRLLGRNARVGGRVAFAGKDVYSLNNAELRSWHASDVALITQDPRASINPLHSVGDFLTEGLRGSGVAPLEAKIRAAELLRRVGIRDPELRMRQFPHELSGGLLQRTMIASGLLMGAKLLVADEPTTALDVTTQEEVVAILNELRREERLALIFITHDLDLAAAITDRLTVVYAGAVVETGPSSALVTAPRHPYTMGLLRSRPSTTRKQQLEPIPGQPISAFEVERGCVFADRCLYASDICRVEMPKTRVIHESAVACHKAEELATGSVPNDERQS